VFWHIPLYSLAVEPLYPQVCQKVAVFKETTSDQGPSPVELSRSLNSIACSISFRREDPISIFHLIMEVSCVSKSSKFWDILSCSPLKSSQHFRGTCYLSLNGHESSSRYYHPFSSSIYLEFFCICCLDFSCVWVNAAIIVSNKQGPDFDDVKICKKCYIK
jgi:hypothetical protein